MKKRIIFVLVSLLFVPTMLLSGCGQKEASYVDIKLTPENFSEYLAINVYYTDCQTVISEQTNSLTYYKGYCIGNIVTSSRANCTFNGVKITYKILHLETSYSAVSSATPEAQVDYYGNSHCSFSMYQRSQSSNIFFPDSQTIEAQHIVINGTVRVYKD